MKHYFTTYFPNKCHSTIQRISPTIHTFQTQTYIEHYRYSVHCFHMLGTMQEHFLILFLNLSYSTLKVLQSGHSKPASKCSVLVWAWCCVFLRSSLTTLCRLSVYVGI